MNVVIDQFTQHDEEWQMDLQHGFPGLMPAFEEPGSLKSGDLCPHCKTGLLDYDGLLNLVCPVCEYSEGGCFT